MGGIQYDNNRRSCACNARRCFSASPKSSDVVRQSTRSSPSSAAEKAHLDERFNGMPADQQAAVALERNAKIAEEVYVQLVNKTQEALGQPVGTIGNVMSSTRPCVRRYRSSRSHDDHCGARHLRSDPRLCVRLVCQTFFSVDLPRPGLTQSALPIFGRSRTAPNKCVPMAQARSRVNILISL